jgi:TrmH family RNA methyltransferase
MARVESITSATNPLVKDVRRAIARGSLTDEGWCIAETFHLLEEAVRSDCEVKAVLAAESVHTAAEAHVRALRGVRVTVLPDALFQSISGTQTAQGVMALVKPPDWSLEQLLGACPLVVLLDGVQDPGNAGTIARTAEAFGASGIVFLKGTVSPWNPKVLRASAGSLFRIPFVHGMEAVDALASLEEWRVQLFAGVPATADVRADSLASTDLTGSCGLVIGSEGHGVSAELRSAARDISIPTVGVESLNAAVAAGILLYEARRQRMPVT